VLISINEDKCEGSLKWIGIVVGVFVAIVVIAAILGFILWFRREKQKKAQRKQVDDILRQASMP